MIKGAWATDAASEPFKPRKASASAIYPEPFGSASTNDKDGERKGCNDHCIAIPTSPLSPITETTSLPK